jgi:alkylation response protein AidB-like acyl-CoA dehydrogenase
MSSLAERDLWADFNEVFFDDVAVPRENLLGELNDGWRIANTSLSHERGMLWVESSARLDRAIEIAVSEARKRIANGQRIADSGLAREALANAYVDALALRCLGYRGFAKFARGRPAPEHVLLKLYGSEANQRLFLEFAEALGSDALDVARPTDSVRMDEDWPWVNRYLVSFGMTISGGTSEIQRNIIAERVLGLPR